jgi:hypothetical protein
MSDCALSFTRNRHLDKPANYNKKTYRLWALALIVPVLLLSGVHLFVTSQLKKVLPTLVENLSDGKYALTYEQVRFNYFSPYMRLRGVHLKPTGDSMDEVYEVTVDSVFLSLESVLPILLNDAVSVHEIRLVRPVVKARRIVDKKEKGNSGSLHVQMSRLQDNAMRFFNALSVSKCSIFDGSFRYHPQPGSSGHFNIEHVNLDINDLIIPEYDRYNNNDIEARIKLSIRNPALSIPDSLLKIQVDFFEWDNHAHYVDVGKFLISQRKAIPVRDSFLIMLDTIRIRTIDWNRWLDSGIVKLDTLMAKNGNMYFESGNARVKRTSNRDTVDLKKLKFWDAIGDLDIGHFSARYMHAAIINNNPEQQRNNSLIGDSLVVKGLSIRPARNAPLNIEELGLGVRGFEDKGMSNQFQSSFSRLQVKGNTMMLNNYMIRSTRKSRMGEGASLFIPSLYIEGISLEDVFDKKASIQEIRMESPELFMYSFPEKQNGRRSAFESLDALKPYIDVERLVLNNAKVTVGNRKDTGTTLGTRQFSAVIMTRSAIKAADMDGLFSSFTNVNMKNFFYITPRVQLQMFNGAVDYTNKIVRFERMEGYLNHRQIRANLNNVSITGAEEVKPFAQDVMWHFKKITVGSGSVDIKANGNTAEKEVETDPDKLIGKVDSLNLFNLVVRYQSDKVTAGALVNAARVAGHHIYAGKYHWDQTRIDADDLFVEADGVRLETEEALLNSSGKSVISNAGITIDKPGLLLNIAAREISLTGEFPTLDTRKVNLEELSLDRPKINLEITTGQKHDSGGAGKDSGMIRTGKFILNDPEVRIKLKEPDEQIELVTGGELITGENLLWSRGQENAAFSFNGLRSELTGVTISNGIQEMFKSGRISAGISAFSKKNDLIPMMSISHVNVSDINVGRTHDNDTMEIRTGGIMLGQINGMILQKDSLIQTALKLPPAMLLPGTFKFKSPVKEVSIFNVSLNTDREFLAWDSFSLVNRVPRDVYFQQQPFEKDYITLSTGKLRADDLKPVIYGRDTTVYIRKLTVDPVDFKVERDKRVADDTVQYRPLLANMFKRLNFPLKLDTVHLKNSIVWHNIIDEKTEKEGTIFFTRVDGVVTNIKNFDFESNDSIRVDLSSEFMGKGKMRFLFRQSYEDSLQGFLMNVRMGSMEMKELNRLMIPLNSVRVDKGSIRALAMRVKGNDSVAYGSMDMNYNNLKVSVLNEKEKKRGISSWLANLFVRGQNSKSGIIYTERLREKSVFNYWSRISLNGLMTNLGVRSNGKQIRKIYKRLEKSQLPVDLF